MPDFEIIKPLRGEKIIKKSTFDGFYETCLHSLLQSNGIESVYGAGVATSVCVLNTLHGAFIRGYKTFFVDNCCGDDSKKLHDLIIRRYVRTNVVNICKDKDGKLTLSKASKL